MTHGAGAPSGAGLIMAALHGVCQAVFLPHAKTPRYRLSVVVVLEPIGYFRKGSLFRAKMPQARNPLDPASLDQIQICRVNMILLRLSWRLCVLA